MGTNFTVAPGEYLQEWIDGNGMSVGEFVDRGEYSYKNNLRELIHIAISDYHPKNMEQFKELLASWGVDIFIKNNRVYATDLDIKEAGNPKCTFNLTRLDGRFALKSLQTAFETGTTESEKPMTFEQRRDVYIQRLKGSLGCCMRSVSFICLPTSRYGLPCGLPVACS